MGISPNTQASKTADLQLCCHTLVPHNKPFVFACPWWLGSSILFVEKRQDTPVLYDSDVTDLTWDLFQAPISWAGGAFGKPRPALPCA